jgi:hypothetical protein
MQRGLGITGRTVEEACHPPACEKIWLAILRSFFARTSVFGIAWPRGAAPSVGLKDQRDEAGSSSRRMLYAFRGLRRGAVTVRFRSNCGHGPPHRSDHLAAFDPNRTLAGSKSRTATALTELRQSDMVPARLV